MEIIELCLNLRTGFRITQLVLSNYSVKPNFILTTRATLRLFFIELVCQFLKFELKTLLHSLKFPSHAWRSITFSTKLFTMEVFFIPQQNSKWKTAAFKFSCITIMARSRKDSSKHQWCRSGVFIVNFEHILHHVLVFLLLTLNM